MIIERFALREFCIPAATSTHQGTEEDDFASNYENFFHRREHGGERSGNGVYIDAVKKADFVDEVDCQSESPRVLHLK